MITHSSAHNAVRRLLGLATVRSVDRRASRCKAHRRFQLYLVTALGEASALLLGFYLAGRIWPAPAGGLDVTGLLFVLLPLHAGVTFQFGAYGLTSLQSWKRGLRLALCALLLSALTIVAIAGTFNAQFAKGVLALGMAFSGTGVVIVRHLAHQLASRLLPDGPIEIVVLSDTPAEVAHLGHPIVDARPFKGACNLDSPQALDSLGRAIGRADRVLVACRTDRQRWITALRGLGADVEILLPEFDALGVLSINRQHGLLSACVAMGQLALHERVLKRAFDLVTVLWLLPLLFLALALVSVAIKLEDGGPVFFVQRRIGHGNRFFDLYKFRTMRVEALDLRGTKSAVRGDPRITRIGAFLRSTSIDELPQLLNVLAGSMSIVGPRPHAVGSKAGDELFWVVDERYWLRHAAKPGLTGLAQVRGYRGATDTRAAIVNRIQADLEYLVGWSLWRDIRILAATIGVLAHPNAY
ncbi:sugar transferase [Sphingomonas sp.]|uniref:sugar transferase n=1 Tax=Sphingomonas sp. TaxID=28214 RepID=UPI0025DB0B82|nr:sugar transferase [Sphingomonas sp.]